MMSEKERPLPKPPTTPFGRKRAFEERDENVPLMADRMVAAMAEGRLDEFMKQELPDSEQARTLAMMMMGMSGMMPPQGLPSVQKNEPQGESGNPPSEPPDEVVKAAKEGDPGPAHGHCVQKQPLHGLGSPEGTQTLCGGIPQDRPALRISLRQQARSEQFTMLYVT